MKKILVLIMAMAIVSVIAAGCGKHLKVTTMDTKRVDQELQQGNRGYLEGNIPANVASTQTEKTRQVIKVTVDLPPYEYKKPTQDNEVWGNQGNFSSGSYNPATEVEAMPKPQVKEEISTTLIPEKEIQIAPELMLQETTEYIVQKNDSLWRIAKKVYGNPNKWRIIYEANRATLKDPNKLKTGQKLLLPKE